jgi:hypothetical protein
MGNQYAIKKIGFDDDYITYPSPTSILGMLSKGDALIQWAVNQAVEYIKIDYKKYITENKNELYIDIFNLDKLLNESKIAWKQTRDNTADIGSELHKLVETFINIIIKYGFNYETAQFLEHIEKKDYKLKQMFYQFYNWQMENVKQYIVSEQYVCHNELCYAGTLDFIYKGFDNKIYCVDLKTSNGVYPEHEIQVVAYKTARESMFGKYDKLSVVKNNSWNDLIEYDNIIIDKCVILHIPQKDFYLDFKIIDDIGNKQKSFEALLSFYYISKKRRLNNFRAKERR